MFKFKLFLREQSSPEEEGEKLVHIEHLEDHPINDGSKGFETLGLEISDSFHTCCFQSGSSILYSNKIPLGLSGINFY